MDGLLILNGDTVVNVVVPDPTGQWQAPEGHLTMPMPEDVPVGIGWRIIDGEWVRPAEQDGMYVWDDSSLPNGELDGDGNLIEDLGILE